MNNESGNNIFGVSMDRETNNMNNQNNAFNNQGQVANTPLPNVYENGGNINGMNNSNIVVEEPPISSMQSNQLVPPHQPNVNEPLPPFVNGIQQQASIPIQSNNTTPIQQTNNIPVFPMSGVNQTTERDLKIPPIQSQVNELGQQFQVPIQANVPFVQDTDSQNQNGNIPLTQTINQPNKNNLNQQIPPQSMMTAPVDSVNSMSQISFQNIDNSFKDHEKNINSKSKKNKTVLTIIEIIAALVVLLVILYILFGKKLLNRNSISDDDSASLLYSLTCTINNPDSSNEEYNMYFTDSDNILYSVDYQKSINYLDNLDTAQNILNNTQTELQTKGVNSEIVQDSESGLLLLNYSLSADEFKNYFPSGVDNYDSAINSFNTLGYTCN